MSIFSVFDWITPVSSLIRSVASGGSTTFVIPGCGMTGGEIAGLLRQHGIETWGHMIVNDHYMISVHREDKALAEEILGGAGITY